MTRRRSIRKSGSVVYFTTVLRALLTLALVLASATADAQSARIFAAGGKSITTWHGQADFQAIDFELARPLSPRTDLAVVASPIFLWQPRSWFGNQFGDGNERVRAGAVSLRVRYKLFGESRLRPYVEASTGPMWAEKQVPASTSRFNFISQAGGGVIFRNNIYLGYRFSHISNGGYSPRNPGLNVNSLLLGVQLR